MSSTIASPLQAFTETAELPHIDQNQSPTMTSPIDFEVAIDAFLADDLLFFSVPEPHRSLILPPIE